MRVSHQGEAILNDMRDNIERRIDAPWNKVLPPGEGAAMTEGQAYQIDLDPVHSVIRLTVTAETVTLELAENIYRHLSEAASSGGPYATIYDLSATKRTSIATTTVRIFAHHRRRKQVVVGTEPHIFGLARVFQMCSKAIGSEYQVVQTLEEAYKIVKVRPEDFTQRL